jgi:hypothetical protein
MQGGRKEGRKEGNLDPYEEFIAGDIARAITLGSK